MGGPSDFIYRFGDFTLNPSEHSLERGGQVIYLRPKTFETLSYLVEHAGHLVEKGDLLDEVWADTIVTEGVLTQCIKEIRAALQDDAGRPVFLKTVPRVGYKFIAEVETIALDKKGRSRAEPVHAASEGLPLASPASVQEPHGRGKQFSVSRMWKYSAIAVGLFLTGLFVYSLLTEPAALSFSARDWVLVTDFQNYTGEEVFAAALRTALERELSHSRYVNVVPTGRVLDDLRLMKQDLNVKIDERLGREICLRDGDIRGLLNGSIEEIGGVYEVSVKLIDPTKGRLVKSLSEEANGEPEVLPAIRRLAREVRKTLGESLPSIAKTEQQLARVTTPSLQALALYSKGWQFANRFDWERARTFLERAVAADSSFAMAHVVLGYAYLWSGELAQSRAHFARAARLADGVTSREKYFILGSHAFYDLGDWQQAIDNYELLVALYPDDYWGHENLSLAYRWAGNFRRWREHKKACMRIRPNYAVNHSDLGVFALFVEGDIRKAHAEFLRALALNPDLPFDLPHLSEAFLQWMRGDLDSAEATISAFLSTRLEKLLPDFQVTARWFAARFYLFVGKHDKARQLLEAALTQAQNQPNKSLVAGSQLELALTARELGDAEESQRLLSRVASQSVGLARVEALGWMSIYLARSGQNDRARRLCDELLQERRMMPVDIIHPPLPKELARGRRAFRAQIEGEIALAEGQISRAVERFKRVVELVPPSQLPALSGLNARLYLVANRALGQAYEKLGDQQAAIAAYQAILDHKALAILVPGASSLWVRTLLSMSRALQQAGKRENADLYRDHYLRLWGTRQED
ncbi:hypothetical protein D6833_03590 [Candidatus Parcubacteria bacterium]|nr:MAG: hypothetical protein D6833_03590 [Candidatus Parcubacteria bacterium]